MEVPTNIIHEFNTRLTPDAVPALRFVFTSMEGCAWYDSPHVTDAIKYWSGDQGIFITHLRWRVGGGSNAFYEVSNIDAWYRSQLADYADITYRSNRYMDQSRQ